MSDNNHTVAPWNTVKTIGGKVYIVGANSEAVAEVTQKNASLVAAAPELYEALSNALITLTIRGNKLGSANQGPVFDKIHAALAKARGESND